MISKHEEKSGSRGGEEREKNWPRINRGRTSLYSMLQLYIAELEFISDSSLV